WAAGRHSILALSPILVYAFCRMSETSANPEYAVTFTPASYQRGMLGQLDIDSGITCGAWQLRPESSGYANISSADPWAPPLLQPNFLAAEADQRVIVAALKRAGALLATA